MTQFSCKTCDRSFQEGPGLELHCCAKGHAGRWECCGVEFDCHAHWEQHIFVDSWHPKAANLRCDVCAVTMSSVAKFDKHRKKMHNTNFVCLFCLVSPSRYVHGICNNPSCGLRTHADQAGGGGESADTDWPRRREARYAAVTVEPGPPLNAREEAAAPAIQAARTNQHSDVPAYPRKRYCPSCDLLLSTRANFREHQAYTHGIITLVSPAAKKIKKAVKKEKKLTQMSEQERAAWKAAKKQKKLQTAERLEQERVRRMQEKEKRKKEMEERKKELMTFGPVACAVCSRKFATPGDYAQHLESGTHRNIKRHHVTQAVHMLDVIPPITLAPSVQYLSSTESERYTTSAVTAFDGVPSSPTTPFSSVPSSPTTPFGSLPSSPVASEAGSPLQGTSSCARSLVLASPVSNEMFMTHDTHLAFAADSPFEPTTTYTPNDFAHLGIPYACALCLKTFRTVVQLTAHMNSPVHDPDAFKCPGPKCGKQFAVVSGLIRHLESGCCNLASAGEIFERFALLTTKFSKYLTA